MKLPKRFRLSGGIKAGHVDGSEISEHEGTLIIFIIVFTNCLDIDARATLQGRKERGRHAGNKLLVQGYFIHRNWRTPPSLSPESPENFEFARLVARVSRRMRLRCRRCMTLSCSIPTAQAIIACGSLEHHLIVSKAYDIALRPRFQQSHVFRSNASFSRCCLLARGACAQPACRYGSLRHSLAREYRALSADPPYDAGRTSLRLSTPSLSDLTALSAAFTRLSASWPRAT
ncbi:cytochrome p450 81d1 [Striga asiatica]|uniref:Cytochrome p450 81d1 n=1 Tax=Striga asiatica TaxID=4170 RepID=A0A5A7P7N7_STRAF|nr:cytochrome p450 81d1 [Striga asiatica]